MSARLESVASAALAHAAAAVHAPTRVPPIDILRGLVMVLMALDHVRDFFTNVRFDPLDLAQTSTPLFLTRWITHYLCADFRAARGGQRLSHVAVLTVDFMLVPQQWGFGLPVVYLAWVLVVATLYPACRWFAAVKRRRGGWWLSYL